MNILTKRNGVALMAVMAVLLVLTLLLPVMFTMSESAMKTAMTGSNQLKSSYLARSMLEMSVAAFQDFYDQVENDNTANAGVENTPMGGYTRFTNLSLSVDKRTLKSQTLYMLDNVSTDFIPVPDAPDLQEDFNGDETAYNEANKKRDDIISNNNNDIMYSLKKTVEGYETVGEASCDMVFHNETKYYKISTSGEPELINEDEYTGGSDALDKMIESGTDISDQDKYIRVQNKNVTFTATAKVNGITQTRKCMMVFPTKPSEQNWIVPASLGSNQIFPDVKFASSRTNINYAKGTVDKDAMEQPLYIFSSVGNMILSTDGLKIKQEVKDSEGKVTDEYVDYGQAMHAANKIYNISNMSLGLHPETGTREPDNDPAFNCLRTYNMNSWKDDALMDNYVAFTATNAIQVDMPVNLLVNPNRTGRIGDGLSSNSSLYKVMIFQAPNIVFKKQVNSLMSLNVEDGAYRMTTIMLAAPSSTPYSYLNGSRGEVCKAGKVYFMDDVYIWLIPFEDNGSNYKTQTVYYKNKDIILYKIANAGDIYYFNAEVPVKVAAGTDDNGNTVYDDDSAGFSLTGYFMDVVYTNNSSNYSNNKWWNLWGNAKQALFNKYLENYKERTYLLDDFKKIGNIYDGETQEQVPVVDDFYTVWEN